MILWTVAQQVSLSKRFLRQEYCSGWPFPSPGDLPHPRIEPMSPALADGFFTPESPCAQLLSHAQLIAPLWAVVLQVPLSMGLSRQEYWSGLPFLSPGDLPHTRIKPMSPAWQADSFPLSHLGGGVLQRRVKNHD